MRVFRNKTRSGLKAGVTRETWPAFAYPRLPYFAKASKGRPAWQAMARRHGKPMPGFTLIEVLLSMAVVGLVLTPVLLLQVMIIKNTNKRATIVDRMYAAKKFLIDSEVALAPDAADSAADKKITKPPTTMRFEMKDLASGSALKKFKGIKQAMVTSTWVEPGGKRQQERMVTFLFRPEGKKS